MKTAILRSIPIFAVTVLIFCSSVAVKAPAQTRDSVSKPSEPAIRRTLLAHADIKELPGWETRLYLIEYGPGVAAPLHHHSAAGVGYVLSGKVDSAFAQGKLESFQTDQAFVDEADKPHTTSKNASSANPLKLLVAYTVKKGQPVTLTP